MPQMYKVFIYDSPIIITTSVNNEQNFLTIDYKRANVSDLLFKLEQQKLNGVVLISENLDLDWKHFTSHFKVISAAGGLVKNIKNETLFIFRNNFWDLPKGWIEKGETIKEAAIREVEEECGISDLRIDKKLITTYHIYRDKELCLKETHWFLMFSNYSGNLEPQIEEGISKAVFKDYKNAKKALTNSFANIKLVYESVKL